MTSATAILEDLSAAGLLITHPAPKNNGLQPRFTLPNFVFEQGQWDEINDPLSYNGAASLPMPVEVSSKESLAPFFAHLKGDGSYLPVEGGVPGKEPYYNTEMLEFEKGVIYSDGRVDLCKMVTGPRNIGDLMDSLKPNTFAKHFLLGNNIIGPVGAKAIAAFIDEFPRRFETWYLAGNCIDTAGFALLVNAMVKSPVITNVWLKRNPLGTAAAQDVFRLITQSKALRTLDLDQTELGDAGVAMVFSMLADADQPVALRHIYLNACGVGPRACKEISRYLSTRNCQLTSLYMSNNPIGHSLALLASGVAASCLTRLSLQSCGLGDTGTVPFLEAVIKYPTLKVLDLGQSYATKDLGMRYNWLTCTAVLVRVVQANTLQYLNIAHSPMPSADLNQILYAAVESSSLLWLQMKALAVGGRSYADIKAGQEYRRMMEHVRKRLHANVAEQYKMPYLEFEAGQKRFMLSPDDVRLIDSVYRNRDAGLARRGLKHLQKWWEDDDETLQRVQDGEIV
ncbi:hypothetical protein AMS68_003021 [Peltaster fructicola]|uniref:RNI-like protein n=1 Tax=Peltaster fructicola TaxID=286661 RepID=A0A6H0XRZ2_9PEZI|nr:hypothetical protein AMS68_003021 [Peltaster fructicola]